MPSTRPKSPAAQAVVPVLLGLVFLALLGLAVWGVSVWLSHSTGPNSKVQVNLGEDTFNLGPAEAARRRGGVSEGRCCSPASSPPTRVTSS